MYGHVTAVDGHKRRYTDACLRLRKTLHYLAGYRSSFSLSMSHTQTHTHPVDAQWLHRVKLG
jgi:hypothetical protein